MVQGPPLRELLSLASQRSTRLRRVLNAGAGEGGYSPYLIGLPGLELLVECDISYRCRTRPSFPKQALVGASATSMPLTDHCFDLILCSEVLEHIPEHEQALDELARILVPGGWLLITVPTPPAVPDKNHVREGYKPSELSAMLVQRGFDVVESRFCMYFFFRSVLANWPRFPWRVRFVLRGLSSLDSMLRMGPPMDLMLLARSSAGRRTA